MRPALKSEELLPCPYCGTAPRLVGQISTPFREEQGYIECPVCKSHTEEADFYIMRARWNARYGIKKEAR